MFQSPCYALGVLLSWTNWNSSYLWGNAFVFSLWEKGRHSLQSRIRQKSSVEVLCCRTPLKGAESSAHCCGFFSVTSDKDFFFLWEAGPAAPEPMQVGEMRCLQLQGKKTKQNKKQPGIHVLERKHQLQQTEWSLVLCGQRQTMPNSLLSTPNLYHSGLKPIAVSDRNVSWKALAGWGKSTSRCTVHDHPAMSTQALILHINNKSKKIQVAGEYLEGRNWCKGRRANLTQGRVLSRWEGTEILYLIPRMLLSVWKTAPINWLHCGMKLLFEATMVRTVQQCGPRRLFWWRKWSCCLLLAGTNKFIQQ